MKLSIQNTINGFENQDFYIGLDVHKKQWKITIRSDGRELRTFSMDPSPDDLLRYMQRNYPGGCFKTVYEAGFCGFWIDRRLTDLGMESIVINAADVPRSQKEKLTKTDKVDSRKLAREYENHSLRGIYVPTPEQQSLRSISRLRYQIVRHQTRLKNRTKSFLNFHGIEIPSQWAKQSYWSRNFIKWLKEIKFPQQADSFYLQTLIDEFESQRERLYRVLHQIRQIAEGIEDIKYIISVPGVGVIVAFTLYAELCELRRFKHLDQMASLVGLVPSVSSSGENEKILGLTYRGNKYLKEMLIEAAWQAISKDPALTLTYNNLKKRMVGQKAIVKIAKKLLNRIRYCWLNKQYYNLGIIE